jgi:hypothetical protein
MVRWISAYADTEPGVDDDQSALPYREYRAYLIRRGGKLFTRI